MHEQYLCLVLLSSQLLRYLLINVIFVTFYLWFHQTAINFKRVLTGS